MVARLLRTAKSVRLLRYTLCEALGRASGRTSIIRIDNINRSYIVEATQSEARPP